MALSEISINDRVISKTNAAISEANYHILRQYLLARKPLLTVTNTIDSLLAEHCTTDKQVFMHQATQLACKAQKNSDIQEAISDEVEKNNDNLLSSTYSRELPILDSRLNQLDMKCFHQQKSCNQASSQLHELKINLGQINQTIDRIHNERQLLNSRYAYGPQYPHGNIHTHYPHGTQFTQGHPTLTVVYTLQDQLELNRLIHEENRLIEERRRLTYLVDTKDTENTREERNLNKLLTDKNQAAEHCSDVKRQLEVYLPNKAQQRHIRNEERIAREHARKTDDANLQQLSHKNLGALQQQISTQNQKLDNKRNQLMDKAVETSYPIYITQLEHALQQKDGPKITFNEHATLMTLLTMMKNYSEMEESERTIIRSLNDEKNTLRTLQKNLTDNNCQLQQYTSSNPQLINQNKELAEENINLNLNSESADNHRTNALYTSLFGLSSSLLSGGLISTFMFISPVYFAIPAALALLTVISLTIAVIYHFNKSASDDQITQNKQTICENETTLFKQVEKVRELSVTTIPSLNTQIDKSKKAIALTETKLKDQQEAMSQLSSKAKNVTSTYSGPSTFFGGGCTAEPVSNYPTLPSAPPAEMAPYEDIDPPAYEQTEGCF